MLGGFYHHLARKQGVLLQEQGSSQEVEYSGWETLPRSGSENFTAARTSARNLI
jgi:hypothetical protein